MSSSPFWVISRHFANVAGRPLYPRIPAYLNRRPLTLNEADKAAIKELVEGKAERDKIKAKASARKSKAKRAGELKRMPLVGKAAELGSTTCLQGPRVLMASGLAGDRSL